MSAISIAPHGQARWMVAAYRPVTMFSLRMTHATSKGGKTLVVPTPYVVKMALLDACFRYFSPAEAPRVARDVFEWIKSSCVRFRPPKHCVVTNTFIKMLDWTRDKESAGPFRQTIAYREMAFFSGDELKIALECAGLAEDRLRTLRGLFAHVNSLGKRGGFWQCMSVETISGDLPKGFTSPRANLSAEEILNYGLTHALDDFGVALCSAKDAFERVSTYGDGVVRLGQHRVLTATAIPYKVRSSSRHFTWYERSGVA